MQKMMDVINPIWKFAYSILLGLLLTGCATSGLIRNEQITVPSSHSGYSLAAFRDTLSGSQQNSIVLAFSGGGTRAAALAYGVLQEMRATDITSNGKRYSLLDDVGIVSAVSGGSFTAAYYGLYGKQIFENFESAFLRKNVTGALWRRVLNPFRWFSGKNATELAIEYYDKEIFHGATYADLLAVSGPMILINATDLSNGLRFSFVQEYFDLLCSNLSSFQLSRAVAASSAVPLLFDPVVVQNHSGCSELLPDWLNSVTQRTTNNPELEEIVQALVGYFDKDQNRYAHFVDGGITDNLGLRSIFDMARIAGGAKELLDYLKIQVAPNVVFISVDASTDRDNAISFKRRTPGVIETVLAMTSVQLHRYNTATVSDMSTEIKRWVKELRSDDTQVDAYFIRLNIANVQDPVKREFINKIPTSFSLTDEQVDALIEAGRELLRSNPEFQRLLSKGS